MNVVIIGNHAAGLSAAETLRKNDAKCDITVISKEKVPPYSRCLIPYIVSGEKTVDEILFKPADFYKTNSIKAMLGVEAEKILPKEKAVVLKKGKKVPYDALIVATGATPSFPRIPGVKLKGVFGFRTLKDAENIIKYCDENNVESAVVAGGGLVGIKAAVALHVRGKKVKIVVGSPNILSQIVAGCEAEIFESHLRELGIEIHTRTDPAKILGKKNVDGIESTEGAKIDCQLVVVGKGVSANKEIVEGTDIKTEYGIVIDDQCRTNVTDIYAAGDVTQSRDDVRKQNWLNALWPMAVEEGRVAADAILGKSTVLRPRTSMNSFKIGHVPLISCGLTGAREEVEGSETVKVKGPGKYEHKRFIFKDGCLVGFALVGKVDNAGILTSLVTRGINVSKVKEHIIAGRFDLPTMLPLIMENKEKFKELEYQEVFEFF